MVTQQRQKKTSVDRNKLGFSNRCDSKLQALIHPHHQRPWFVGFGVACCVESNFCNKTLEEFVTFPRRQAANEETEGNNQVTLKWRTASTKHSQFHKSYLFSANGAKWDITKMMSKDFFWLDLPLVGSPTERQHCVQESLLGGVAGTCMELATKSHGSCQKHNVR